MLPAVNEIICRDCKIQRLSFRKRSFPHTEASLQTGLDLTYHHHHKKPAQTEVMVHDPALVSSCSEIPGQGFKPEPLSYLSSLAPRRMDRRRLALLLLCRAPWQFVIVRSSTKPTHLAYYSVLPVLRLLDDSLPASSTVTQCGQPDQK